MENQDIQLKIDTYNTLTWSRIQKKSVSHQCPPHKDLTTPCLLWGGYIDSNGYGNIHYNGSPVGTHRVSLMIFLRTNSLPDKNVNGEKLEVGHKCDVRNCCEPTHLYLATQAENGKDKIKNGTFRGERHPNAKISEKTASNVKLSKGKGTISERAYQFNVAESTVNNIDGGRAWAYLDQNDVLAEKRLQYNTARTKRRRLSAHKKWSKEYCIIAQKKFNNRKYAEDQELYAFNGTPCRFWIRSHNKIGYPQMYIGGQKIPAHVMACVIGNNFVKPENLEAAHECGHMSCVNPLHLTFKTHAENMTDKIKHGTNVRKISWETVLNIRKRYRNGESLKSIASLYHVSDSYVSLIGRNKMRKIG